MTRCLKLNWLFISPGIGSVSRAGWPGTFWRKVCMEPLASRQATDFMATIGSIPMASAISDTHL